MMIQRCRVERLTLQNSLAIAAQSPDQFAYNLMKGPGFMAVVSGEVVHVIECIPTEVTLNRLPECYLELPVERNGTAMFLTPKTHVLKNHGTTTSCDSVLPPLYQLDDKWYQISSSPVEVKTPKALKPLSKATWKYRNPSNLATSGIYT